MKSVELQVSTKDWIYISIIGTLIGFFISLFFYYLNESFQNSSTIFFGTSVAFTISLFSVIFINLSNNHILPNVSRKFWYIISFIFSFLSGAIGFLFSFSVFYIFDAPITRFIEPYSIYLTLSIGSLTFLIGLILHQFISMKYKNESIKTEILSSKLKALESELNPHFLFNALNSMSELVYINPKKAETSILNLAKFLRNAIDTKSIIDLESELEMVKTYIDIENIRFNNNIKLNIINPKKKNPDVPKFSIQLLVENAIKHGYMNNKLNIDIEINDNNITIVNDGKKINTINFGTGLNNLNTRLKLLNLGSLEYNQDEKTKFIIKLDGN
jgi:sensor histidine kinase YesM